MLYCKVQIIIIIIIIIIVPLILYLIEDNGIDIDERKEKVIVVYRPVLYFCKKAVIAIVS